MPNLMTSVGFHDAQLATVMTPNNKGRNNTRFTYTFSPFSHPFVGDLLSRLNTASLPAMLDATWLAALTTPDPVTDPTHDYFHQQYQPHHTNLVQVQSIPDSIDVSAHGAYSVYNWELFFHLPLTIAVQLSKARRFAEAQRWFHFIFDPTSNDPIGSDPNSTNRFWQFLAFRGQGTPTGIDALLELLSQPPGELSADQQQMRDDVLTGYRAILANPFQPHAVARTRQIAYQYNVVMKYLDNLIAWGDDRYTQYTVESINEATQLYVLAANLLGERPQRIPSAGIVQPRTFAQLKAAGLDPMGNALVELESQFTFNYMPATTPAVDDDQSANALFGIGRTLYFCVPQNNTLLTYWDTVADRLFKIRHCEDITGVVRPLPLFDPPLDPGMLVKAAAAGIDLSSVISGAIPPGGPLRAQPMIQKALELCGEVRSFGGALLAAQEKGDAEQLAQLRQRHEIQIAQLTQDARFLQWKQAEAATDGLLRGRATALQRYQHYRRLLGLDPSDQPDTLTPDRRELTEDNFDNAYDDLVGQFATDVAELGYPSLQAAPEEAADLVAVSVATGNLHMNLNEYLDLNVLAPAAAVLRTLAGSTDTVSAVLAMIPDIIAAAHPMGVGADSQVGVGTKAAIAGGAGSSATNTLALISEIAAAYAAKAAGYQRRTDEWILQHNQAAAELMLNGRQILASLIAEQVARHEYNTVVRQVGAAQEVDQLLHDKFTNQDLYLWMQGEISRLYYQWYRLAFDTARRAEQVIKQELMRPEVDAQDFVQFNYWDGGRKGLLAGEALHLDVKRLECAYHDNNKRELELTTHISVRQLDPMALLALRATGRATVSIREWLLDRDCPGHYLRRIKTVALSIPSVSGPYTSVNCTLTLQKSSVRTSAQLADGGYPRQGPDDDRFIDYLSSPQPVVTSTAVADAGMFETVLRDERFLPFEGAGAVSTWMLELPTDYPAFDYSTISDVILHLRYTARPGVDTTKVSQTLHEMFGQNDQTDLALLFSLRHDFPNEWQQFAGSTDDFIATVSRSYFPYFTQSKKITITALDLYGTDGVTTRTLTGADQATTDLSNTQAFTVTAAEDTADPKILTRTAEDAFLIVRYTLQ
jgi:hypothetical protein